MDLRLRPLTLLILLVACGGGEAPPVKPAPAPAPVAPPPAPAPAPVAENIGPEGPTDLAIPSFTVSTDAAVIEKGKGVFEAKGCPACHKFGEKLVGPDLNGVGERRKPEWIARMILHSGQMVKRDPVAKQLFRELMVEMPAQGVTDEEIGPLVSFLVSHPSTK